MSSPSPYFLSPHTPWLPQLAELLLSPALPQFWENGELSDVDLSDARGKEQEFLHDLSDILVLLPSQRACQRLLQLLHATYQGADHTSPNAAEARKLLIPPRLCTPWEALPLLLELPETEASLQQEAGGFLSQLAWRLAAQELLSEEKTLRFKKKNGVIKATPPQLALLAEEMAAQLGETEYSFSEVARLLPQWHPVSRTEEIERWEFLGRLEKHYQNFLKEWGVIDRFEQRKKLLALGTKKEKRTATLQRVIAAGLLEQTPLLEKLLAKVDPLFVLIGEEKDAPGFTSQGGIVPSYWLEKFFGTTGAATVSPLAIPEERITPCHHSYDQARHLQQLLHQLRPLQAGTAITIAVPDRAALPFLTEVFAGETPPLRWAGGRSLRGGRLLTFLERLLALLEPIKEADESRSTLSPSSKEGALSGEQVVVVPVAALIDFLQVPDLQRHFPLATDWASLLARWQREKLLEQVPFWHHSSFLSREQEALSGLPFQERRRFLEEVALPLQQLLQINLAPLPLAARIAELHELVATFWGEEELSPGSEEGHYFLGSLQKLLQLLEELPGEEFPSFSEEKTRSLLNRGPLITLALFLKTVLLQLSSLEIAPPEAPHANDLVGWGELALDDAPTAVILSAHEGSLPHAPAPHPMLALGLRPYLGLPTREDLLARDAYFFYLIIMARQKQGYYHVFAPLQNGEGEPTRPSRLLTLGESYEQLAERLLFLQNPLPLELFSEKTSKKSLQSTSKSSIEGLTKEISLDMQNEAQHHQFSESFYDSIASSFSPPERLSVTSLKTYLHSPRLFYWQHLQKVREPESIFPEMEAFHLGTLLHELFRRFGEKGEIAHSDDAAAILQWLEDQIEPAYQALFWSRGNLLKERQLVEIKRVLEGFSKAQAHERSVGWQLVATEGASREALLEKIWHLPDGREVTLYGKIDRLDWHPEQKRWRLIDYKSGSSRQWRSQTPAAQHYQQRRGEEELFWKDLQLPLYLYLLDQWGLEGEMAPSFSAFPPTRENTELVYFQLPWEPWQAGISAPFPSAMILPAWEMTNLVLTAILDGQFEERGEIEPHYFPYLNHLIST